MKAKISYEEITTYVKEHYKVSPELKRIDDKTIEAAYMPAKFLPAISIQIKVEEVKEDILCIVYESSSTTSLIIEKAIEQVGDRIPHGIEVSAKDKRITLYLSQIEQTKKIMEHIRLENMYINEDSLELAVGLR